MPQHTPVGKQIPFPYITGLDPHQQQEIYRDFEAVLSQIVSAPTVFDAVIDPILTASDPAKHQYVNLTELVANETWAAGTMFSVGVHQRGTPQIIEPSSPLNIAGLGDLSLFGIGPTTPDATHKGWDWAKLTCAVGQQVFYYNLVIEPTSSGS